MTLRRESRLRGRELLSRPRRLSGSGHQLRRLMELDVPVADDGPSSPVTPLLVVMPVSVVVSITRRLKGRRLEGRHAEQLRLRHRERLLAELVVYEHVSTLVPVADLVADEVVDRVSDNIGESPYGPVWVALDPHRSTIQQRTSDRDRSSSKLVLDENVTPGKGLGLCGVALVMIKENLTDSSRARGRQRRRRTGARRLA